MVRDAQGAGGVIGVRPQVQCAGDEATPDDDHEQDHHHDCETAHRIVPSSVVCLSTPTQWSPLYLRGAWSSRWTSGSTPKSEPGGPFSGRLPRHGTREKTRALIPMSARTAQP